MSAHVFLTIFITVFLAELGDKTQLATMLFAADKDISKTGVFLAASSALIVATAIGVVGGSFLSQYLNEKTLSMIAGCGFIIIGIVTLVSAR